MGGVGGWRAGFCSNINDAFQNINIKTEFQCKPPATKHRGKAAVDTEMFFKEHDS